MKPLMHFWRTIILLLFILNSKLSFSQPAFTGRLITNGSPFGTKGVIIFPLARDTMEISDPNNIKVNLQNPMHWIFYFLCANVKSGVFYFDAGAIKDSIVDIQIPDISFYREFQKIHTCPICKSKESVIPVEYGKPGKKAIEMADRGEIKLGGCNIANDNPQFFCKKDEFLF